MFLSKYGVARHIYIPVPKASSADHAVGADWTPAAGDVKISKDGGAAANVTNLPTAIAMGNSALWDFSLTATEMEAAQVKVLVADSATKAVTDTGFEIETYGHASAQHAFDLDTSSVAQTGDSYARLGAPAGASVSADIADVEDKVDDLETRVGTPSDLGSGATVAANLVDIEGFVDNLPADPADASDIASSFTTVNTKLDTIDDFLDTEIAAIKAKTDNLPTDPADASDIAAAFAALDAKVDTIDNFLDTEIAAILDDTANTLDDYVDDLESRLTAALATALQAHALGIGRGVVDAASTTTAVVFKTVNGAAASGTNDFYNGRHIVFTSGALTLQATSITDYVGATKTATVPALTGAPAEDVTFIIV